ncbi:unnamed protein product [Soboliphyme baturini]|uniref:Uncharacterized protein n=1 Tax=Soboliphyme baturini TaxID=241478 RepID=A0A183I9V8_9BILA|nr:unnamed protein product [Soboliphyme baturini]
MRSCLTEILLKVTDGSIVTVAQETHRKALMKGDDDDTESEAEQSGDADHTVIAGESSTTSETELFKRPLAPSPSVIKKQSADAAATSGTSPFTPHILFSLAISCFLLICL